MVGVSTLLCSKSQKTIFAIFSPCIYSCHIVGKVTCKKRTLQVVRTFALDIEFLFPLLEVTKLKMGMWIVKLEKRGVYNVNIFVN